MEFITETTEGRIFGIGEFMIGRETGGLTIVSQIAKHLHQNLKDIAANVFFPNCPAIINELKGRMESHNLAVRIQIVDALKGIDIKPVLDKTSVSPFAEQTTLFTTTTLDVTTGDIVTGTKIEPNFLIDPFDSRIKGAHPFVAK